MKVTTDACLFGAWAAKEVKIKNTRVSERVLLDKNALDIGTGTGLLSLMFAQKNATDIDAIEIDEDALEQAKENAAASPFAEQLNVIHGDVKTFSFSKKYDLIISNPPFYEQEITSRDQRRNLAHHHSGLLLEDLLTIIKNNLAAEGSFYLLLPYKRTGGIRKALFEKDLSIVKLILVRQSTKHDYFRIMLAGKLKDEEEAETIIEEISIWDDKQQYTEEFKELLKDYYLHL
jgi:tRNA1Val (adenine37-N6)-methyltransferase